MKPSPREDLDLALTGVEKLLKDPNVATVLAEKAVNVSLAMVALDGLRAYLDGHHGKAAEELETAAEEIAARHRRMSTESPS
jgi:hypothetical protein